MADKAQETPVSSGKSLANQDGSITKLLDLATQNASTPAQMLDLFLEQDIPFSSGEELTGGYVLVDKDDKARWCAAHEGKHLFLVSWQFNKGSNTPDPDDPNAEETTSGFVSVNLISDLGKFILNDSAQGGIFGQLKRVTAYRENLEDGEPLKRTPTAGLNVPRGLRKNKPFWYDVRTKRAIRPEDLDNVTKHPMNFRKESRQTWSLA